MAPIPLGYGVQINNGQSFQMSDDGKVKLEQSGTKLGTVRDHHLSIECSCGHSAQLAIADLLERHRPESTIRSLLVKMKCRKCGTLKINGYELFYKARTTG